MYVVVVMPRKQRRASTLDLAVVYSNTSGQLYGFFCFV